MWSRRDFVTSALGISGPWALGPVTAGADSRAPKPLRVLILGGTGNIGPYFVRAAVERGHRVSVFSRGRTAAGLPTGVEHLIGDRNGDLNSIRGRDWDAVLDIATYGPGWVRRLGQALKDRVGHYTFISTISVYDSPASNKITDEGSKVLAYHESADPYSVTSEGPDYGALKILCEKEAERQFPERTFVVRPVSIAGPGDSHPYIYYWPLRMQRGGEVLAAGDPSTPVQFIDVRDLAEWTLRMVEKQGTGIYNAAGPIPATNLAGLIKSARATAPVSPRVTWVTRSWLLTQKDKSLFEGVLFWEFNRGYLTGFSNARALAQGLTTRPVATTLDDELRWFQQQPPQTTVFTGFRPKPNGGGFEAVTVPWTEYLAHEKRILTTWHASH